jgi:hypothetical protein
MDAQAQYINAGPADPTLNARGVVSAASLDANGSPPISLLTQN